MFVLNVYILTLCFSDQPFSFLVISYDDNHQSLAGTNATFDCQLVKSVETLVEPESVYCDISGKWKENKNDWDKVIKCSFK